MPVWIQLSRALETLISISYDYKKIYMYIITPKILIVMVKLIFPIELIKKKNSNNSKSLKTLKKNFLHLSSSRIHFLQKQSTDSRL